MRPGTLRAYAIGVLTGSVMTSALFVWTAPAHADVSEDEAAMYADPVCSTLTDYPSIGGVLGIGLALRDEGYSGYDAGQIIGSAVVNECPQFAPLLKRFIAIYGGNSQVA
jgi:hypothetical protein